MSSCLVDGALNSVLWRYILYLGDLCKLRLIKGDVNFVLQ